MRFERQLAVDIPRSRAESEIATRVPSNRTSLHVIELAHVTLDSDTTFKVKRSKVKVTRPLWLAVLLTSRPTWTSS